MIGKKGSKRLKHSDLVEKARRWLRARGCGVIITEMTSGAGQEPDAIGWTPGYSILIECKANRADFLRDKKKIHHRSGKSMGERRFYLAPEGIIKREEVPVNWGLLEARGRGVSIRSSPAGFNKEKNIKGEIILLVSAIRRIKGVMPKGTSVKAYVHQTGCRATVTISKKKGEKK